MGNLLQEIYLPFEKEVFKKHFAKVKKNGECIVNEKHLEYYEKSINNYKKCEKGKEKNLEKLKTPCQIEKDERFWTVSALMNLYYSENWKNNLIKLLEKAFSNNNSEFPQLKDCSNWEECLGGESKNSLELYFEVNLPSPKKYNDWLVKNHENRHIIPYVLRTTEGKKRLEGATVVDAILINPSNGFSIIFEAKVLSDISYEITYDIMRNQIARNIDVMLEKNEDLCEPLNKREPEKTLFLLITPQIFKMNYKSRLYGYKYWDYKLKPTIIGEDLPHRENIDWGKIASRLGWLTWEDFKKVNSKCCKWLG